MGAVFAVPLARVADDVRRAARRARGRSRCAARAGAPLRGPLEGDVTLLSAPSATGCPPTPRGGRRDGHIPIGTESLNAAMAATVALYEMTRVHGPHDRAHRRQIRAEAEAAIGAADDARAALEELRRPLPRAQGRAAEPAARRRRAAARASAAAVGKAANQARQALEALIEARGAELEAGELRERLGERPRRRHAARRPAGPVGHLHLLTATRREIEDVFFGLGFRSPRAPRSSSSTTTSTRSTTPPTHPARARTDTFCVRARTAGATPDAVVLRTHTSPVQVRVMEQQPPPIAIIVPGRVYRRDSDATHTPQFHQIEGLAVDEDITLADLKGTLLAFARAIFGDERDVRLRPHFFPFTEPSVEVDVSCFQCAGTGVAAPTARAATSARAPAGWRSSAPGWSTRTSRLRRQHGYDPEQVQGFAFGMGVERIAMLKHGIPDLRLSTTTTSASCGSSGEVTRCASP